MNARIIELPKILDQRGNLTFIEEENHIPFKIERTFWIYDVPGGENRGGHAYRETEEFIVALSGSFTVQLDNGHERQEFHLNRSYYGLYVPRMVWRENWHPPHIRPKIIFEIIPFSKTSFDDNH